MELVCLWHLFCILAFVLVALVAYADRLAVGGAQGMDDRDETLRAS